VPPVDLSKLRIERDASGAAYSSAGRALRKALVTAVVVLVAGGAAFLAYKRVAGAAMEVEQTSVTLAYPYQALTMLNATGYVVAQRKASVASKATGRLEWLGVQEGSRVKKGEVIARLERLDVSAARDQAVANVRVAGANLEQAQAELREAKRALDRSRDLLEKRFVSQASHDVVVGRHERAVAGVNSAQAAVRAAEANQRAAEVAVEQTVIRAPFDGVVLTKNANVGDTITPFSSALDTKGAVVTIADMSTLEVEADVSESNLGKVKVEQPCEIELDALPSERFQGTVSRTVPTVDRAKATVMTKIRFRELDPRILPDMSAKVAFLSQAMVEAQRTPRPAVNAGAVVSRRGRDVVYVVQDGKAVETPVQTGERLGDLIELKQGPRPGDKVVLRPAEKLTDGTPVKAARK
jgi:RND family efflux transporter MFP subunit